MVQNRKTRRRWRRSDILKISGNDVEVVGSFKYLGSVIDTTSDETGDIKVRILPIKLITLWKLYSDHNKFPEIIIEDYL